MANLSLFGSLNTALLGVYTHKLAMNVVAHNIANYSTDGYSRQRPVIQTTSPIPLATLTQPSIPLMLGTGSQVTDVQRVRDLFLDIQYRQTSNRYSYFDTIYSNLHYIEQLFSEPGDSGIRSLYDSFLSAAEEIITDPTNVAAKREFISRAEELVTNIKDLYTRLQQLREDINQEIYQTTDDINSMVERLAQINEQIRISVAFGTTPNDLLDERDRILDELSQYANISYYETSDGQTILMFGDQVVLSGSVQTEIRAEQRPYAKGFFELFAGNSKITVSDGKLKALFDLRDGGIVKYMNYLDEFALSLTDKLNLIHREGFDSSGKITGLNLFNPIVSSYGNDDPALYRILGSRKISSGPLYYATGLSGYTSESQLQNLTFTSDGSLVLFDGSNSTNISISSGSNVSDLITQLSTTWLTLNTGQHSPDGVNSFYRLYFESSENLRNTLVIDENGGVLSKLGFSTKQLELLSFSDLSNVQSGSYTINFEETLSDGTKITETLNIAVDSSTTLNDIANQVNSQLSNVHALIVNDTLLIIPNGQMEFDPDRLSIVDDGGFFVQAGADYKTYTVLDPSETLENIAFSMTNFDATNGFDIIINNTKIHIDPTRDTLEDLVTKINSANTGVTADLTPHSAFVLRAGESYGFDLMSFTIEGPQGLFEMLGLIDTNSDPVNFDADWSVSYTLISRNEDFDSARNRLSLSEFLTVDKRQSYEPYFFVDQWNVSNALLLNAESLAVDIGKTLWNITWNATDFLPTGESNVEIVNLISSSRYETLLSDGKESFYEFMSGIVAELGVESESASKMKDNTELLRSEIDQARESVKGVSLDEEMTNMIQYQHAFNASARVITTIDEMIGRVIDKLGVVGR
ncbi:MAG TPA: flagellar hook-associated protein FlgK [Pseudothermotoga sp.]|uniref:flagellar hook-associated protein FlgK n=1 Tax=Pseudothermotoga lettingae TaxID=177758 RepID=UPI000E9B062B|nr:flagellar hook-associated protein FlgK [Pseudothermotoga lettingae]HBT26221.1 flagellar hook-associated protein FlgK [Pseudothermotoga sp.]